MERLAARIPVRTAVQVDAVLPPLVTTLKSQLHCGTALTGQCSEQKSCNWGHTEEATSRLVGGVAMWNGLVPHHRWQPRIWRDISAAEVP